MLGGAVTPPAASAAPSRLVMNASWSAREDHTSDATNAPSSAVPAACESSPAGQSPSPVCMSMPSCLLTASYSASVTPVNCRISASGIGTPCGCHLQDAPVSAPPSDIGSSPGGPPDHSAGKYVETHARPGRYSRGDDAHGADVVRRDRGTAQGADGGV